MNSKSTIGEAGIVCKKCGKRGMYQIIGGKKWIVHAVTFDRYNNAIYLDDICEMEEEV